jgi:methylaspartate ammonia-lyase
MKYIVTESQYNLILESKKYIQLFQDLIDSTLSNIRKECEQGIEYVGVVSDESCEQLEDISEIKVTSADWVTVKHSNRPQEENYMSVRIMVYYSSIHQYGNFDADELTYDLELAIRKSTGLPFILNYDSTNTNTSFEW